MIDIIPAIDIIKGKCVRLSKGDYLTKKVYNENPLEVALQFADAGCRRLHVVDLDGAKSSHVVNYATLERLASRTNLIIDFGGGVKSDDDIKIAFSSGAAMVTGGSVAVKQPKLFRRWLATYGPDKIILGADARNGKIAVAGWQEDSNVPLIPFVEDYMNNDGVRNVITTDISCDGMLSGASTALYEEMLNKLPEIFLIASGGIGKMADIEALEKIGVPAVIVGKAIYEGHISLSDIQKINLKQ